MSNPTFSVIIPAYNSSRFIRKGLDSIRSQTFTDYELIVVCDSCGDSTEQIAKEYGAITDNVTFGLDGLTRDHGIAMATGDYVLFMDDDDWFLHEYCFQQLADKLHGQDLDMLAFGYIWKDKGYFSPTEENIFQPTVGHVWANAWCRTAIGDAHFGNARFSSDTYFLKAMKQNVKTHMIWDMPIYYYNFMRHNSQTDLFCKGLLRQSPIAK